MDTWYAADIKRVFTALADVMEREKQFLIELDGAMGDGDLGLTMSRGFQAAAGALQESAETDIGKLLAQAGMVIARTAPSTMGTLIATGFMKGGRAVSGRQELALNDLAVFWGSFVDSIMERGKAAPGEKTIIDALQPARVALEQAAQAGAPLAAGCWQAAQAAAAGLEATKNMVAKHGRPAYYAEKSLGRPDPGATVGTLIMQVFADYAGQAEGGK